MKLSFALFSFALGEAGSFAQLGAPQPGIARFSDGSLRVVRGVPANLIIGRTRWSGRRGELFGFRRPDF